MKKYQIIYADPPWNYKVYSKKGLGRSAESHYPTMSIEDICALPVGNLADKDCALFLWVTIPCLLEGLSVLKAWGFTYKTVGFVWVKQNRKADSLFWGMGYWTRSNVELCILATKGHPKRINAAVHQVIDVYKRQTRSGRLSESWNRRAISCVPVSVTAKAACAGRITSFTNSPSLCRIYLHWKIQHWIIQRRKSLRRKNQRN